jgi:EAL domain-containing protein (putative c-di-GMP-specific phosphodiesterase class I)
MKTGRLFWISLLAALAIGGVLVAFYMVYSEKRYEGALIAAVLLLGIAQLVSATLRKNESAASKEDIAALRSAQESAFHEAAGLRARIEAVERKLEAPRDNRSPLLQEMNRVRRDFHQLASHYLAPAKPQPEAPAPQPASALQNEHLDLYLEPIIEVETNATAHYRACLWLRAGTKPGVGAEDLYASADRGGLRPALDVFALTRVIPVLRRLSSKGRRVSVFISVGRATLAARAYVDEMIRLLNDAPDIANFVVLEIEHGAIAELADSGIQGLAHLARAGATLGLGGAAAGGIEFAALKNLGFHTIEFAASPPGALPAWLNAARIAVSQGMDVLVGGIENDEQAQAVRRWARYVSGPHYAAPRLVRADLGAEPLRAQAA